MGSERKRKERGKGGEEKGVAWSPQFTFLALEIPAITY